MFDYIIDNFQWVFIIVLVLNFSQRRIANSVKKRKATLYLACLALVFYTCIVVIKINQLPRFLNIVALVVAIVFCFIKRDIFWPFKLKCNNCGKKLTYEQVIGGDENLCNSCYLEKHPEEKEEDAVAELTNDEKLALYSNATKVTDIDWDDWEPTDICVLTHVLKDNKLLFIEKKQGMGKGYFNASGGHVEEYETATEAAIREVKEETGITIDNLEQRGILYFNFKDMRELAYVYYTESAEGELLECDEARPFWLDKDKIPYDNMWEDDKDWLAGFLEGKKFVAHYIFDDKTIIDKKIVWLDE